MADIDTQALGAIPETALVQLVAQKLAVYRDYMEFLSAQRGEQRYKLSYLIDMSNAGVSSLLGDKKTLMQKIFGVGSTYFPESVWKIYVVNAPFTLRMGWSVVKALIHPVTEAKIKIVGSVSDAKSRLARDGFSPAALPKEFGGYVPTELLSVGIIAQRVASGNVGNCLFTARHSTVSIFLPSFLLSLFFSIWIFTGSKFEWQVWNRRALIVCRSEVV